MPVLVELPVYLPLHTRGAPLELCRFQQHLQGTANRPIAMVPQFTGQCQVLHSCPAPRAQLSSPTDGQGLLPTALARHAVSHTCTAARICSNDAACRTAAGWYPLHARARRSDCQPQPAGSAGQSLTVGNTAPERPWHGRLPDLPCCLQAHTPPSVTHKHANTPTASHNPSHAQPATAPSHIHTAHVSPALPLLHPQLGTLHPTTVSCTPAFLLLSLLLLLLLLANPPRAMCGCCCHCCRQLATPGGAVAAATLRLAMRCRGCCGL
jgi:hypothetical protein